MSSIIPGGPYDLGSPAYSEDWMTDEERKAAAGISDESNSKSVAQNTSDKEPSYRKSSLSSRISEIIVIFLVEVLWPWGLILLGDVVLIGYLCYLMYKL